MRTKEEKFYNYNAHLVSGICLLQKEYIQDFYKKQGINKNLKTNSYKKFLRK